MPPNIVHTPDILFGKPRIEGKRIGVFQIGGLVRDVGWSHEKVCEQFDVTPEEVAAAVAYYDDHPQEMARIWLRHQRIHERVREQSRAPEDG